MSLIHRTGAVLVPQIANSLEQISENGLFHRLRGGPFCFRRRMKIDVSGGAEVRVAKEFLSEFQILVPLIDDAAGAVPEAMKSLHPT